MAIRRRGITITALACALALIGGTALAQPFPNKPVRVLIRFAAGGPTDVVMRVIDRDLPRVGAGDPITGYYRHE